MANDWKNVQYKDGKFKTGTGGGGGSSTFAGLDDTSFSNLQNGQVPKYNSVTQKWENANESGGGGTVTDVTVDGTSVVNQQGVAEIQTPDASGIEYDNQQSGLQATDVQSAIDELAQGSGGGATFEIVTHTGQYDNNTTITLSLTKSYTNPYPYPVNCLPLANWNNGARVVAQTDTVTYDSVNNQISFKVYTSSTQNYKCDWMIIDLG